MAIFIEANKHDNKFILTAQICYNRRYSINRPIIPYVYNETRKKEKEEKRERESLDFSILLFYLTRKSIMNREYLIYLYYVCGHNISSLWN